MTATLRDLRFNPGLFSGWKGFDAPEGLTLRDNRPADNNRKVTDRLIDSVIEEEKKELTKQPARKTADLPLLQSTKELSPQEKEKTTVDGCSYPKRYFV